MERAIVWKAILFLEWDSAAMFFSNELIMFLLHFYPFPTRFVSLSSIASPNQANFESQKSLVNISKLFEPCQHHLPEPWSFRVSILKGIEISSFVALSLMHLKSRSISSVMDLQTDFLLHHLSKVNPKKMFDLYLSDVGLQHTLFI